MLNIKRNFEGFQRFTYFMIMCLFNLVGFCRSPTDKDSAHVFSDLKWQDIRICCKVPWEKLNIHESLCCTLFYVIWCMLHVLSFMNEQCSCYHFGPCEFNVTVSMEVAFKRQHLVPHCFLKVQQKVQTVCSTNHVIQARTRSGYAPAIFRVENTLIIKQKSRF